jgi:hypothetical protein
MCEEESLVRDLVPSGVRRLAGEVQSGLALAALYRVMRTLCACAREENEGSGGLVVAEDAEDGRRRPTQVRAISARNPARRSRELLTSGSFSKRTPPPHVRVAHVSPHRGERDVIPFSEGPAPSALSA